jgi:hypothetical protein
VVRVCLKALLRFYASTLLRFWATGGVPAADEAMFDIALPLFESEDVKLALPASVKAFLAGEERPAFAFNGRRKPAPYYHGHILER